jgi:hypothetical protein
MVLSDLLLDKQDIMPVVFNGEQYAAIFINTIGIAITAGKIGHIKLGPEGLQVVV